MDISRKLHKEDLIFLNNFQNDLIKINKKITQKDLIDKAIRFASINKKLFFKFIFGGSSENNTKEMTEKFLSLPKADIGKNWIKEIDTIEHNDSLKRNKNDPKSNS